MIHLRMIGKYSLAQFRRLLSIHSFKSSRHEQNRYGCHKWMAVALLAAPIALSPMDSVSRLDNGINEKQKNRIAAYAELAMLLGDRFSIDEKDREEKGTEMSGYTPRFDPDAVVWPLSTSEVSSILRICNRHKIPVIAYGGGTSVEGHTAAVSGGVCVDLKLMDRVVAIHHTDEDVVVQGGIGWMQLNEALEPHGFFVSADPGPGACLAGMCATGCSGTNAVRYGTIKDQIFKTRQRPRKSSAGYDLARLFVGSEGTLGIITEVTLKMRAIPSVVEVAFVPFPSIRLAAESVTEILRNSIQVGAVELCDEVMVHAMNSYSDMTLPTTSPLLLFKFSGRSKIQVREDIKATAEICRKYKSGEFVWCSKASERDRLWNARKHAFWAAQAQRPEKRLMATDVAVPISRSAELIDLTVAELQKSNIYGPIVGHLGDGNFHVCLMVNPDDPIEMEEARRLNRFMVNHALLMEGTCTGEHGIGYGKKIYLNQELGIETVQVMKKIKKALDPNGIMNPNKIFDE